MEGKRTVNWKGYRSDQLSRNSRHYTGNFLNKLRRARIQVEVRIPDAQNMIQYSYFPHSFFWYTGHGIFLSKSMQYGPPWEANCSTISQHIHCIFGNQNFHFCVQNSPSLLANLKQAISRLNPSSFRHFLHISQFLKAWCTVTSTTSQFNFTRRIAFFIIYCFTFLEILMLLLSSFRQPWKFEEGILWISWLPDVVLIATCNKLVKRVTNKAMNLMAIQCTLVHQEAQEVNCEVKVRQNTTFILPFFIHSFTEHSFIMPDTHFLPFQWK